MSVKVVLPNAFQKHTNGTREIQSAAQNLPQLITEIETSFPALKPHLRDNDGKVRRFINFYVNEEDIRFLGNDEYAFKDGDEVLGHPLHRRRGLLERTSLKERMTIRLHGTSPVGTAELSDLSKLGFAVHQLRRRIEVLGKRLSNEGHGIGLDGF